MILPFRQDDGSIRAPALCCGVVLVVLLDARSVKIEFESPLEMMIIEKKRLLDLFFRQSRV